MNIISQINQKIATFKTITYFDKLEFMCEGEPIGLDPELIERINSIDIRHTFARGSYSDPNSGREHNPVLEINQSGVVSHVTPDAPEHG